MLEMVLYTKANCSLCVKARRVLEDVQQRHGFQLIEVDITTDEALYERYKNDIPVGMLGGEEVFRHRIDQTTLENVLSKKRNK